MFARLVAILAALAITVMTTVAPVHAARMGGEPDLAMHAGTQMHAKAGGETPCDQKPACGSTDTTSCEMLCAGLAPFVASPDATQGRGFLPGGYDLPPDAIIAHRVPELGQRPPNPRFL